MRARTALKLPRPKELPSNKLSDIQEHFRRYREELDKQWRLLFQDVAVVQVDTDGWIYFGGKDTDNSYRIGRSGNDWQVQRRESGTWTPKFGAAP